MESHCTPSLEKKNQSVFLLKTWIWSGFSKRSGKSLGPLKVGLTKQQQLFNIWPFLQQEPLFSFSWHISTLKSIYIYIFTSRKTYIDHHLTVPAAMFYFVKSKRLVNKGSTRWVLLNCTNKVPPSRKAPSHNLFSFAPHPASLRPSCFSSSSPSSPHRSLTLFFAGLLFFGRSFGVAQVTRPKPSKQLKRCLFSPRLSFLLILTPFILPPPSPQTSLLTYVSTFFSFPDWKDFSLLEVCWEDPLLFLVINVIIDVFLDVTKATETELKFKQTSTFTWQESRLRLK